ncbi:hypothetical protein ABN034_11650 [Actinopolymorpha sp. B11F2]|uniref:hypothetical protein n=1 Tax=Actinopolymorpha sp. B11F2 TaxID=3160862 RepID=UPI0032E39357
MGDRNRAWEFADFIDRTFPHAGRIADVAGGHGELSYWLQELGHSPVVIEPRDVRLPRWIHRDLRKRAVREGHLARIERIVAPVEAVDLRGFSLVVGLHPDQATEPAVRAAVAYDLDFAVVPCCVFPMDGRTYTAQGWLEHLATLAPGSRIARLPISGANAVVWRRRSTPWTGGRLVSW